MNCCSRSVTWIFCSIFITFSTADGGTLRFSPAWTTFYGKIHKKPLSYYISFLADCQSRNGQCPTPDPYILLVIKAHPGFSRANSRLSSAITQKQMCAKLRTLPELITFRKLHTFSGRYRCRLFNHDHNFLSCLLRSNGHQLNIIHSFVRLKIALISWRYNDSTSILVISFQRNISSEESLLLNVPNA